MSEKSVDAGLILRLSSLIFIFSAVSLIATAYNSEELLNFLRVYQPLFIFSLFYIAISIPVLKFGIRFVSFEEYSFSLISFLSAIFLAFILMSLIMFQPVSHVSAIWGVPLVELPFELPSEQYLFVYNFMQFSISLGVSPTIITSILLNLIVAFTESTTFQIALPDIFDRLLPETIHPAIRFGLTIVLPNFLFGAFHYFSYGRLLRNTAPAFVSGAFLTLIYFYLSGNDIPSQSALVDAHWIYNVLVLLMRVIR